MILKVKITKNGRRNNKVIKRITYTGKFCSFDIPRFSNGRVYTREGMEDALNKYIEVKKRVGVKYGELYNHSDKNPNYDISISKVSHIIKDIEMKDDGVYGEIEILDTPDGKLVKKMMESGLYPLVSPRCYGVGGEIKRIISFDIIDFVKDYEDSNYEEWTEE